MKRILFIGLTFLGGSVFNPVQGQHPLDNGSDSRSVNPDKVKLDSALTYDSELWGGGVLKKSLFDYNSAGMLIRRSDYNSENDHLALTNEIKYSYDPSGNVILYSHGYWDREIWQFHSGFEEKFEYNESGYLVGYLHSEWNQSTRKLEFDRKNIYKYNEKGSILENNGFRWNDSTNSFQHKYKSRYSYDERDSITESVHYQWVDSLNAFLVTDSSIMQYDSQGNLLTLSGVDEVMSWLYSLSSYLVEFEKRFDSAGNLVQLIVGKSRNEYMQYDASGNRVLKVDSSWNEASDRWIPGHKSECSFDTTGALILETNWEWDPYSGTWKIYARENYTNYPSGKLKLYVREVWDTTSMKWDTLFRNEFYFDLNGYDSLSVYYNWSYHVGGAREIVTQEKNYDSLGNLLQYIFTVSSIETHDIKTKEKTRYDYDEHGNLLYSFEEHLDVGEGVWWPYDKYEYSYDYSYSISEIVYPGKYSIEYKYAQKYPEITLPQSGSSGIWNTNDMFLQNWSESLDAQKALFHHMVTTSVMYHRHFFNGDTVELVPETTRYFYSSFAANSIDLSEYGTVLVYPNPVSDFLTIDVQDNFADLTIHFFDLQGRLQLTRSLEIKHTINVQWLEKGMYIYLLKAGGHTVASGKLIKD